MQNLPIQDNPLQTRQDLIKALETIVHPLIPYYSDKNTQLVLGNTGTWAVSRTANMEALARPLWGLVPAAAGGFADDIWLIYHDAIRYGTNPSSPEYWGDIEDYDQKTVETAVLGLALCMAPEQIFYPLSKEEQTRFADWLYQVNYHKIPENNWRFFIVLVNLGLKNVGMPYSSERIKQELEALDTYYLGEGWYSDGATEQRDYYIAFAMHYYALIYAHLMKEEDPVRSKLYIERAKIFAQDFIYWFSEDGDSIPYGRSLTYRFAQCAFWGALALNDVEVFSYGVMKGIVLRHLRDWFQKPIFSRDGILSIGYSYENLVMSESYNAPGSPAWSLKAFLPLALSESHPFWQAKEEPLPALTYKRVMPHPHMVFARKPHHVAAFTAGQYAGFEPAHMAAKYEKFVYSNVFGFSVPRGDHDLAQNAPDSMLALSEQDSYYRVRRNCELLELNEEIIRSRWKPWPDVTVTTTVFPGLPWHYRIHDIETQRPLFAADCGFSIPRAADRGGDFIPSEAQETENGYLIYECPYQGENETTCYHYISGIYNLSGEGKAHYIKADSNSNLIHPRTYIPMIQSQLKPGKHRLISAVYGGTKEALPTHIPMTAEMLLALLENKK
ncbi:MAG: DUF2264 domain-containing protein [Paenibacillaceae bacterium]|nr:DUF2264 domain-containing protein [Paenibacillaceae bacterium]